MLVQADMAQRERQLLQEMDQVRADLQLIGVRCVRPYFCAKMWGVHSVPCFTILRGMVYSS